MRREIKEINENLLLFSSEFLKQKEYWRKKLTPGIAETTFLYSHREFAGTKGHEKVNISIPGHVSHALVKLSKDTDLSIYIILAAALKTLIHRYTSSEDITILSPVYQAKITGETINKHVFIRDRLTRDMTFKELILAVKTSAVEAYQNQDYPLPRLVEYLFPPVLSSSGPEEEKDTIFITNITCLLTNIHQQPGAGEVKINGEMVFSFAYDRAEGRITGSIAYEANAYETGYIKQIARHFVRVLESGTGNINTGLARVPVLSEAEKEQLLIEFNNNRAEIPPGQAITRTIREQAEKTPGAAAIVYEEHQITYEAVNRRTNQLAGFLRDRGIKNDQPVGILFHRSPQMIESILAVWKAGGSYMPLDTDFPPERQRYMLEESRASILLTGSDMIKKYSFTGLQGNHLQGQEIHQTGTQPQIIPLDLLTGELGKKPAGNVDAVKSPGELAYIIFTSGSTGKPRGAMVEHQGMMNHIRAKVHDLQLSARSVIAQNAAPTFDISVWQFFAALTLGGRTVIYPDQLILEPNRLLNRLKDHGVNILEVVPSYLSILLESQEAPNQRGHLQNLDYLLVTGEEIKPLQVKKWFEKYPTIKMVNAYGPTEAADDITHYIMDRPPDMDRVPIGKPLQNLDIYILDQNMQLCPIGVKGEICVSGVGVGRGYLNNPGLTAERFCLRRPGGRFLKKLPPWTPRKNFSLDYLFYRSYRSYKSYILYQTGDLGCWLPNGTIQFFGRKDYQVKIRGFRIELGEIENRLNHHPGLKQAVVIDKEDSAGNKFLCAYMVARPGHSPGIMELKEYLSVRLPDYMIPSYFRQLEQMPLTPNGKIDRKALPDPGIDSKNLYVAPRDKVEEKLAVIWSETLGIEKNKISINSNFFELGGHSLRAIIVISRIHKAFNVKLPIAQLFETPVLRNLSAYIKGAAEDTFTAIEPAERKEYYPLSPAQKRLYILQQMTTNTISYNLPYVLTIEGNTNTRELEAAFKKIITRHESLRTSFEIIEAETVQRIHQQVKFGIEYYQVEVKVKVEEIIGSFVRPFDLSCGPLLRVGWIKGKEQQHILMIDMHHIITDGTSQSILTQEFMAVYTGKELSPLRLQYKDYSQWQQRQQARGLFKSQEHYWLEQFDGEIPILSLPIDFPRPVVQSFEGAALSFTVAGEETETIKTMASDQEVTLFMVILAIFNILLSKISSQEDIVIGTAVMGRRHVDLNSIVGMFANTLALRNFLEPKKNFSQLLTELKINTIKAFENQDYQFEDLVEKTMVKRDASRNPIFDVMFSFVETGGKPKQPPAQEQKPYTYENKTTKFDITLNGNQHANQLFFSLEYSTKLFAEQTIKRLINYFKTILTSVKENVDIKIGEIDLLSREERQRVLVEFNDTARKYPANKTIHELYTEQVKRTPDQVALAGEDEGEKEEVPRGAVHLSYGELNEKSHQLANELKEKGVGPDTIVGIMINRSVEMIVGILGILKAGGAYMPIETDYPPEWRQYMLKDSGARILVSEVSRDIEIIDLLQFKSKGDIPTHLTQLNLAYIIYTSGSTGRAKGVSVEHQNVVRLVKNTNYLEIKQGDRLLQTGALAFDASTFEIWGVLLNGLTLYLPGKPGIVSAEMLKEAVRKYHITGIWLTSPLFNQIVEADIEVFSGLRYLLAGGDVLSPIHINRVKERHSTLNIINGYGPTENTTFSTTYLIDKKIDAPIPIGRPIANSTAFIVDKSGHTQPIGIPGELWVGGDGVARGYLNNPELTHEKFDHDLWDYRDYQDEEAPFGRIINAFGEGEAHELTQITFNKKFLRGGPGGALFSKSAPPGRRRQKIYKTGDLARWQPDGNIQFLGRIDNQVKIRGYRVELGEIESYLSKQENIKTAVVLAKERIKGIKYLCAYVVPYTRQTFEVTALKANLQEALPAYMVPSYIVPLESFPLTNSGKLNREALPEPGIKPLKEELITPGDETEEKLVSIWSELLKIEKKDISIISDFFELGGTSLNLVLLVSKIYKEFGTQLSVTQIYNRPNIREISNFIRSKIYIEEPVMLLNQSTSAASTRTRQKLFCFPPGIGFGIVYKEFAQMITDCPVYSFNFIEDDDRLNQYAEIITSLQPEGPYVFLGWSAAGVLMFEIANLLENRGAHVSDLILFDCIHTEEKKIFEESDKEFIKDTEKYLETLGLTFLKEKVRQKAEKYLNYIQETTRLEVIHANAHFVFSEDYRHLEHIWGRYTTQSFITYNGFGLHANMFSPPALEENAKLIQEILTTAHTFQQQ